MTLRDLMEDEEFATLPESIQRKLLAAENQEEDGEESETPPPPEIVYDNQTGAPTMPSAEYINRLIHVGVPKKPLGDKSERLWVFSPEFLEQVVLNNLDAPSQSKLWRRWVDIEAQSQGDGNDELTQSRQRAFALRVVSQRARSDIPDTGTRERMALVTVENRQRVNQNITTSTARQEGARGLLSRLFGK